MDEATALQALRDFGARVLRAARGALVLGSLFFGIFVTFRDRDSFTGWQLALMALLAAAVWGGFMWLVFSMFHLTHLRRMRDLSAVMPAVVVSAGTGSSVVVEREDGERVAWRTTSKLRLLEPGQQIWLSEPARPGTRVFLVTDDRRAGREGRPLVLDPSRRARTPDPGE